MGKPTDVRTQRSQKNITMMVSGMVIDQYIAWDGCVDAIAGVANKAYSRRLLLRYDSR